MKKWKFETKAIHGGTPIDKNTGATKTPVYQSTAYAAETAKETSEPAPSELYTDIYATDDNCDD